MSESITYLHNRSNIDKLSHKERFELLNQMIDTDIDLNPNEVKLLNKEQLKRYANKQFDLERYITPEVWNAADDIQRGMYIQTQERTFISPELFDSMDEKWRKDVLFTMNVISGRFLAPHMFEQLSEKEKRYYVNAKIIRTKSFYPCEIPYLTDENLKKVIDAYIEEAGGDFSPQQLNAFSPACMKYYKQKKRIQESVRKYIRKIISEVVSGAGTLVEPQHKNVVLSKDEMKQPQYFKIALNRANKICSNPIEKSDEKIKCPVNYEIDKTVHSVDRQFRHIGNTIEDEKIKSVVSRGIDKIVKLLLSNAIQIGDKIHLKDGASDLNIILSVKLENESKDETIIILPVVTVINKGDFVRGLDTKLTIKV